MRANIQGLIDGFIPPRTLTGWVMDADNPDGTAVFISGHRAYGSAGKVTAGLHRKDLASRGTGKYGFSVEFREDIPPIEILSGRVRVTASLPSGAEPITLSIENNLQAYLGLKTVGALLPGIHDRNAGEISYAISRTLKGITSEQHHRLYPVITNLLNDATHKAGPQNLPVETFSPVLFPVGLKSGDAHAELGRDGFLFLTGGTNKVSELYRPDSSQTDQIVDGWMKLIESRKAALDKRGIRYIQIIIPEKLSILSDLLPGHPGGCTPALSQLESRIDAHGEFDGNYISAFRAFLTNDPVAAWRKLDTHLSPYGARLVFSQISRALGHTDHPSEPRTRIMVESGDLSLRFFGRPAYASVPYFAEPPYAGTREKTFEFMAFPKHIGRKIEWNNPEGPLRKRVMAFGNSFMDGGLTQESISYWLSSNCSEYKYNFNPNIDFDYVDSVKPDCVVCQTTERFIGTVPAS